MRYEIAAVAADSLSGDSRWTVVDLETSKVATTSLLTYNEAQDLAYRANERLVVKANWPDPKDPEVVALVISEDFQPEGQENLETLAHPVYRLHKAAETIARKRAGLH